MKGNWKRPGYLKRRWKKPVTFLDLMDQRRMSSSCYGRVSQLLAYPGISAPVGNPEADDAMHSSAPVYVLVRGAPWMSLHDISIYSPFIAQNIQTYYLHTIAIIAELLPYACTDSGNEKWCWWWWNKVYTQSTNQWCCCGSAMDAMPGWTIQN